MLKKFLKKGLIEAGCDEAGRGCLAGPVVAAAVILPKKFKHPWLNDSKQLNEKQRKELRVIIEAETQWATAFVDHEEIDRINILNASILAMHKALDKLTGRPEHIIIDGNRFKQYSNIPHETVIKGDGIYMSIAAASVLAKTHRDDFMEAMHEEFPHYNWLSNKGYPTLHHRDAIRQHGICYIHRKTFRQLPEEQLELF
ncbi:MAG: ribonuclease HII [Bacteroidia bacterium]|nr:ribonuclease HII [Bacteroidia bacterium]